MLLPVAYFDTFYIRLEQASHQPKILATPNEDLPMKLISTLLIGLALAGCATVTKDLAKTLRYADGPYVGVKNIEFKELQTRKRGEACTWNLLFLVPMYGDGSIISAADQGNINNVELVGETGLWYFPVNKNCTVVYGDSNA